MSEILQGFELVREEVCGDCLYYRQHYAASAKGELWALWFGHCGNPGVTTPPADGACRYKEQKSAPEKTSPGPIEP